MSIKAAQSLSILLTNYRASLRRHRAAAFLFILTVLAILSIIYPLFPAIAPASSSPVSNNIVQFTAALISNLFAALLWYTLLQKHEQSARLEPLMKAFPFLSDKTKEIYVILASLPSDVGHQITGIGEARALGILLESFNTASFPGTNIYVLYSSSSNASDIAHIIETKDVILLGGPNFNKFTHYFFEHYSNRLDYIFQQDIQADGLTRRYSGSIISNRRVGGEVIALPLPEGVAEDTLVLSDCGLIVQIRGEKGNVTTLLAGGMTTGVWVAAKVMTNSKFTERWLSSLKIRSDIDAVSFEIVFNCAVQNLSVSDDDIEIIRTIKLPT
ncbi:MAG: hypothetical protein ACLQB4_05105 [Beijerinckiaceae bacterium]